MKITQLTHRTLIVPRARTSDDAKDQINSVIRTVREDVHLLTIRVDRIQTELHLLRTHTNSVLGHIRDMMEAGFIKILTAI